MSGKIFRPAHYCLSVMLALAACGKTPTSAPSQAAGASTPPGAPSVTLTANQLESIKIGTAGTFSFPVEREAVGSVSFTDDPAIIQAESTLLAAAASEALDRRELDRVKSLGDINGIPQKELEQATSDEQTASAALRAARDAVRVLGKSDAQISQMISTGQIDSASPGRAATKWVVANAAESDSPMFHSGQPVKASVLAFPGQTFEGVVTEVYSAIDPNSHRVTLRTQVADPKDELRPGMLADLVISVRSADTSIAVPDNGVVREGDGTMTVWVTTDRSKFFQRLVQTGLREDGQVQILQGLRQGELVVTDGAIFLDNLLSAPPSD